MMDDTSGPEFLAFQQALLGRYSLQRELGRGGMGVVYLARDVQLDRPVALKVLPAALATQPSLRERFLREARTSAKLSHPNIVPIFSVDETRDFVFFAMAFVDGETLAQRVASRGPLVPADATRILREVAWALAYAHAQGVVHRDVKPANILLETGSGRALVADFGIARLTAGEGHTTGDQRLGTPEFMSPEQASGEAVDARSDLYSLGVVAFHALSGQLPFTAPTVQAMLAQHITRPAPPIASVAPGVPRTLGMAVDRCLLKDPAARFESGEALANALATSLEKRTEVPVPIRVYLDHRHFIVPFVPMFVGLPVFLAHLISYLRHPGTWVMYKAVAELGAAGLAVSLPIAYLVYRLRGLLRLGYGPDDIVLALRSSYERRREEFLFEYGLAPSARERWARFFLIAGATTTVTVSSLVWAGMPGAQTGALPLAFFSAYAAVIGGAFGAKWNRLRSGKGPFWSRFWSGALGRAVSRFAGLGLGPRAIAADRPTELAIAMSAESLFASLPKEVRHSLGDFPAALRRLEDNARKMRERLTALDASIAEAQRAPSSGVGADRRDALVSDLRARRHEAHARLQDVITALETLRLQLLRIGAGAGSLDSLTADLNAARELGDQTDRLLAGRAEVEKALK